MTIAEESRRLFNECKHFVKKHSDTIPYIPSGTSNRRTRLYKMANRYSDDAKIDFELGVISKEEFDMEIAAVRKFEQALANMEMY